MTSVRLIKRNEVAAPANKKRTRDQAPIERSIIKEWIQQQQSAQPANTRAAFAALFAPSVQIG